MTKTKHKDGEVGIVYLIHFNSKLHHAQHYIGWCKPQNLGRRINHHVGGTGAKLMRAVTEAGIEWHVVKTWHGVTRHFERKLKNRKNASSMCPACKEGVLR